MPPQTTSRPLPVFHGCVAVVLYVIDAFLFAQGVLAGIVTVVMVLLGLTRVVRGVVGDRRHLRSGFAILAIYSTMMASVVATIVVNNQIARGRADEVVAALKLYRSATGDYPSRLLDLVPGYLPAVPRAKYTLMFDEFTYHYDATKHQGFLMYVAIPPFGRPTYWLDTDTWGYLD